MKPTEIIAGHGKSNMIFVIRYARCSDLRFYQIDNRVKYNHRLLASRLLPAFTICGIASDLFQIIDFGIDIQNLSKMQNNLIINGKRIELQSNKRN